MQGAKIDKLQFRNVCFAHKLAATLDKLAAAVRRGRTEGGMWCACACLHVFEQVLEICRADC